MLITERLLKFQPACSRTIRNAGANRFVRGSHHRRCKREGITNRYDALFDGPDASWRGRQRSPQDNRNWDFDLFDPTFVLVTEGLVSSSAPDHSHKTSSLI